MLSQNPRQAEFLLGKCPQCQKVVRIPVNAVTAQSNSQVCCPICDGEFEIADLLEQTIPSVKVIEDIPKVTKVTKSQEPNPSRINAIDTPELFHVSKEGYRPSTEKKNGRFVVPELLSRGIKKKRNRTRKHSRRDENDPRLAESLAKLKQNTSTTSLPNSEQPKQNENRESRRSKRSEKSSSSRSHSEENRKHVSSKHSSRSDRSKKPNPLFLQFLNLRSISDLQRMIAAGKSGEARLEWIMAGTGALLAIPILHLMLWWFVGVDPLGLAKPTGYVIPFIVPNELKASSEDTTTAPVSTDNNRAKSAANRFPNSDLKMQDGKLPIPKIDPSSVHIDDNF